MKKLLIFNAFLTLLSCTCLPQIPTQVLYVDQGCTVTIPDYTAMFLITDNCTNHTILQYPVIGSVLQDPEQFSVDIVARDAYGNTDAVTFNVQVIDTVPPVMQYIGDTVVVYHRNEIDLLISSFVSYRQHLGDSTARFLKLWFVQ